MSCWLKVSSYQGRFCWETFSEEVAKNLNKEMYINGNHLIEWIYCETKEKRDRIVRKIINPKGRRFDDNGNLL